MNFFDSYATGAAEWIRHLLPWPLHLLAPIGCWVALIMAVLYLAPIPEYLETRAERAPRTLRSSLIVFALCLPLSAVRIATAGGWVGNWAQTLANLAFGAFFAAMLVGGVPHQARRNGAAYAATFALYLPAALAILLPFSAMVGDLLLAKPLTSAFVAIGSFWGWLTDLVQAAVSTAALLFAMLIIAKAHSGPRHVEKHLTGGEAQDAWESKIQRELIAQEYSRARYDALRSKD